jgi:hypothetical protein
MIRISLFLVLAILGHILAMTVDAAGHETHTARSGLEARSHEIVIHDTSSDNSCFVRNQARLGEWPECERFEGSVTVLGTDADRTSRPQGAGPLLPRSPAQTRALLQVFLN